MAKDKKLTDSDKATYLRSALKSKEAIQIITSQHGCGRLRRDGHSSQKAIQ